MVVPQTAAQPAAGQPAALERYDLPAEVTFPEGIAYDPATGSIYTASALTGTLARVNAKTKAAEIVAPAGVLVPGGMTTTFPAVLGMKLDDRGRLWIAGGRSGKFLVVDAKTGKVLKQLEVPDPRRASSTTSRSSGRRDTSPTRARRRSGASRRRATRSATSSRGSTSAGRRFSTTKAPTSMASPRRPMASP